MKKQPQRIIEEVIFENLGPLTARELLKMPRDGWETLRAGLTDHRHGKLGMVARCIACQGNVYVTTAQSRPLFAHYQGSNPLCPWYSGKNNNPNDLRAAKYHGQQESEAHRRMCELIAELCALDERCVSTKIDEYRAPTENEHGRYPDVLSDWGGFGQFAVEYQMSHTFQTEVSQRCIHYEREDIPLLWVLSSFDPENVPQPVSDVVHRHRGNAFVLCQGAVAASRQQKTLVLSCFMSNGHSYDAPIFVRFDALTFPDTCLPFFEDRLAKPLLERIAARRRPYFDALRALANPSEMLSLDELRMFENRARVDRLIKVAFSIVAEAAGKPSNFATEKLNIRAMMNTYQNSGSLAPYAKLLTTLIENTSQRALLSGTVGKHLQRSMNGHRLGHFEQVTEKSPEWRLLSDLLPEALDPFVRQRLKGAGALPAWAI